MSSFGFGKFSRLALIAPVAFLFALPTAADAQVQRVIKFYNQCSSPIEFVIRHSEAGGTWDSHGWYKLRPYQTSTFADGSYTLTQADGYSLYFYARATDGSGKVWSGDNRQSFQNAYYPFMEMNTSVQSDGTLMARITCN